ncbi:hypothetical protein [Nocardioides marinquilinus]
MSTEFDRRVRDLHEAPFDLDSVRGKAVRIRRKRRVGAAVAGLAAAAVVLPVALLAANGQADEGRVVPAATQPTEAVDPTPPAPEAEPPADALYLEGDQLHLVDGSVTQLPSAASTYTNAVVQGEGRIVAFRRNDDGSQQAVDVIEDGQVVDSYPTEASMVVGDSGVVAFVTRGGEVRAIWESGTSVLAEDYRFWTPVAVTGGPACDDEDCQVYLRSERTAEPPVAINGTGAATPQSDVVSVLDATDDGLVSTVVDTGRFEYCSNLFDKGRPVLEQCDYRLDELSPDGRYALGTDIQSDGIGPGVLYIVDLDGAVVATFDPGDAYMNTYEWLDDQTIITTVYDFTTARWSVQTMDLDGTIETIAGPAKGGGTDPSTSPAFYVVG